jgi:phosphatidylglycerophosphate synthase
MVAVEGGKSPPSGELFNDIPDRIADPLILVSAGFATTVVPWVSSLGWAAGLGAVLTAYVRTLAAATGAPVDFRGPMAKQHRMAIMTLACLASSVEPLLWDPGWILLGALVAITGGCIVTVARRARAAYLSLETGSRA